jgi:hypothetical protein
MNDIESEQERDAQPRLFNGNALQVERMLNSMGIEYATQFCFVNPLAVFLT